MRNGIHAGPLLTLAVAATGLWVLVAVEADRVPTMTARREGLRVYGTLGLNSAQVVEAPPMRVIPLSEVKSKLSELVDVVERRDESITITRNGKPVAMIVSPDEYEGWRETSDILQNPDFLREIRDGIRSLARTRKRYTVDELFGK